MCPKISCPIPQIELSIGEKHQLREMLFIDIMRGEVEPLISFLHILVMLRELIFKSLLQGRFQCECLLAIFSRKLRKKGWRLHWCCIQVNYQTCHILEEYISVYFERFL